MVLAPYSEFSGGGRRGKLVLSHFSWPLTPPSCLSWQPSSFPSLVSLMLNLDSVPRSVSSVQGFVLKGSFRWASFEFVGQSTPSPSDLHSLLEATHKLECIKLLLFSAAVLSCQAALSIQCLSSLLGFSWFQVHQILLPSAASQMNGSYTWVFSRQ